MSSLIVEVARIDELNPHPNADRLELGQVKGWQVVLPKGVYKKGEKVVYFPPDTVIPSSESDRFGVTKYLSNGRIRCTKLRGEPSFGLAVKPDADWPVGEDVAEYYGATKYEPPVRVAAGDAEADHPLFVKYTDIENMRNYPNVLTFTDTVVVTEKIHGTNCRVGLIDGELMAGSKRLRRKRPDDGNLAGNTYWFPLSLEPVQMLLNEVQRSYRSNQVVLFGEVYGSKVQSLNYGMQNGKIAFRAFDLLVGGKYLDAEVFSFLCASAGVEMVPILAVMPFDLSVIATVSEGPTVAGAGSHIREGVVVRPMRERHHPAIGRVILKYVSDTYLFGDQSDTTDE